MIGYYEDYCLKLNRSFYLNVHIQLNEIIKIKESLTKYFHEFYVFVILNSIFDFKLILIFLKDYLQASKLFCQFSFHFPTKKDFYIYQINYLILKTLTKNDFLKNILH